MDFRVERLHIIRHLPRPGKGMRAILGRAPQAEAALKGLRHRLHPRLDLLYKLRRRLATATVGLLTVWLFLHVMFSANGMVAYKQKRAAVEMLRKDVECLRQENDTHAQQIKALKSDPKAIEKEAREQLHYARPGELIYISPLSAPLKPVTNPGTSRK